MVEPNVYEVGGCVRDGFLKQPTKDIDFAVELPSYEAMVEYLTAKGFKIHIEHPEHFAVRCGIPKENPLYIRARDADFVLCRKDGFYSDGRRPDNVEIGSIYDDLARRDFTMNAIAVQVSGSARGIIDPHNGRYDIVRRKICTVGSPYDRFYEDALRMLRAIRFAITKGFDLDITVYNALDDTSLIERLATVISDERKRSEMTRMLAFDTPATIMWLKKFRPSFVDAIFCGSLWLKGTLEKP